MPEEIPLEKGEVRATAKKSPATHTVGEKDTISRIAQFYKVSVGDLLAANDIKGSILKVGQKLHLPK